MSKGNIELWMGTPLGQRLRLLLDWRELYARRRLNDVGELRLTLPRTALPASLLVRDAQLEANLNGARLLGGVWLLRWVERIELHHERLYRLHFVDQIDILDNPIIAYPAGTSYTTKSGKADDLIKAFARENMGSLATDPTRNLSNYLQIEANTGQGAQTYKVATKRRLLGVCQDVARASAQLGTPLFFDFEPQSNGTLTLRTYPLARGNDHRRSAMVPVVLSPELRTMESATRSEDYRFDFSVVYAAGQGAGTQRVMVTTSDTARLNASPWARKERFVDARNLKDLNSLNSTAAATLYQGRPRLAISGVVRDRPGCVFGTHWNYGDLVEASVDGLGSSCRVEQVTIEVAQGGAPVVSVELVDMAAEAGAGLSIEQQLEEIGTSDAATITQTPEPYGVPQAGADGKIAAGWLSVDLSTIGTVTPTPNAIPKAGGAGTLADGWLSANIARTNQLTPHSVSPTANASPLADASGKIADSWLSGILARLGVGVAAGRVAYWDTNNTLGGDSSFTWSAGTLKAGTANVFNYNSFYPNSANVGGPVNSFFDGFAHPWSGGFNVFKRGSVSGGSSAVQAGSELGFNGFYGWDGTQFYRGGYLIFGTTEAWTSANHGTSAAIYATRNNGGGVFAHTSFDQSGALYLGKTSGLTGAGDLDIAGNLRATGLNFVDSSARAALQWNWGSNQLALTGYGSENALLKLQGNAYYTYFQLVSDTRTYQFATGGSGAGGLVNAFYIFDQGGSSGAGTGTRLQITPTLTSLAGRVQVGTIETSAQGNKWQLGGYAAGGLGASGYVNVVIDGVARRLLVG